MTDKALNITPLAAVAVVGVFALSQFTPGPAATAAGWAMTNNAIAYCMSEPEPADFAGKTMNMTVWWKTPTSQAPEADTLVLDPESNDIVDQVALSPDLAPACPGSWRSLTGTGLPNGGFLSPWSPSVTQPIPGVTTTPEYAITHMSIQPESWPSNTAGL